MAQIFNRAGWIVAGVLAFFVVATVTGVIYGGPLDPSAPPSPTGKTQITSLPFTISTPGSYILNGNLNCLSCTGITVATSNVTIDLQGFALIGTGTGGAAVTVSGSQEDITLRNGIVTGTWGQGGMLRVLDFGGATRSEISDIRLSVFLGPGTFSLLELGSNSTVRDCVIHQSGAAIPPDGIVVGGNDNAIVNCEISGTNRALYGGLRTRIIGNDLTGNTEGIVAGSYSEVRDNYVSNNACGITVGSNSRVEANVVAQSSGACAGISVSGSANSVSDNTVGGNTGGGISVSGDRNAVSNNQVLANLGTRGIFVQAGSDFNQIISNNLDGGGTQTYCIRVEGTSNLVVQNTGGATTSACFSNAAGGNTFGPTEGSGTGTDPPVNAWANVHYGP